MNGKLSLKTKLFYSFAGLGQNMIYSLSASYLMIFYTAVFNIKPLDILILFVIARIWDAFNDFIMGTVVDNTKTKLGKFRPYLLFAPIPIGVLTVLTFTAPAVTYALKLVYVFVTYILWGMLYTVSDVPYWGLSASLTKNNNERVKLISLTRFMTLVGMGIPFVVVPLFLKAFAHDSQGKAYLLSAIFISVIGSILFSFSYFGTREVYEPVKEHHTLKMNMKYILKNKPLLVILTSGLVGFGRNMLQTAGMYFAMYNLNNEVLFSYMAGVFMLAVLVTVILTPVLTQHFSKKDIYIATSLLGGIFYIFLFFTGYGNFTVLLIGLFFCATSNGFFTVLQTAMIADSIDYLEAVTHKRLEGITFSGQTFFAKLSAALTSAAASLMLMITHYNPEAITDSVKTGIFILVTLIPGVASILSAIPMAFYNDQVENMTVKQEIAEMTA